MEKVKDIFFAYKNYIISAICIIVALILITVSSSMESSLTAQNIADRWSKGGEYTEVSVFFSREAYFSKNTLGGVRNHIRTKINESVALDDYEGRYFIDSYATQHTIDVYSLKNHVEARGFGVGGDYFLFHPIELSYGNYFDEATDPNEDGVVIDENLAWKLFGAVDVAGMNILIGDRYYIIRGVVKQDDGLFSKAIDEDIPTIYMQYAAMDKLTGDEPLYIDSYEALIVDPVKEFALTTVDTAMTDVIGLETKDYSIIENSKRYSFLYKLRRVKTMFLDSMNTKNICLPYWENKARGVEQVTQLLFIITALVLIYPTVYILYKLIKLIKFLYGKYVTPHIIRGKEKISSVFS